MDDVARCTEKLADFRTKELKDVLSRAGIMKQGKKQDLVDRIVALLYDEGTPGVLKKLANGKDGLVAIIEDVYRKMQNYGARDSTLKKQNSLGTSDVEVREEAAESSQPMKLRCPCGSTLLADALIQCEDLDCGLWQHIACVFTPDNPGDDLPSPRQFFCEICRLKRADPFWETVGSPMTPRKLAIIHNSDDGGDPLQTLEKTFQLTKAESQLLKKAEYDVQAWCILFNDKVQFRMQWPKYTDLQINGIPVRTGNRPGSQLLGANGRDDGAKISMFISEGVNKISVSGCDARVFCFGVRLVKRRTVEQVLSMIPKEADGESLEIAIARVQRCIGGGISTQKEGTNNDDDDDLEVISDAIMVNLCCPMSGARMRTAGRFKSCAHIGCFDLETFVKLNERSRMWQCPICIKNYSLEDLIIDPYFNRVVTMMQNVGEEIIEIDVKPDGCWRVRKASEFMDLAAWHHPDGTAVLSSSMSSKLDEQELSKDSSLRLGIQNHNDRSENLDQKVITMSSADSGDDLENEAASINQNCSEQIGNLGNNASEVDSMLHNACPMHKADNRSCGVPDVIFFSDSEDEVSLVYPESMSTAVLDPDEKSSIPRQIPDASCASSIKKDDDDYLMAELLHTASVHSEPFCRLSDIDTNDSGAVVDVEPISVTCSPSNSGSLSLMFDINPGGPVSNSSVSHHDAASHSGLVKNHLDYVEENLSLQGSLLAQTSLTKQLPVGSSSNVENHICLGLGTNKTAGCGAPLKLSRNQLMLLVQKWKGSADLLKVLHLDVIWVPILIQVGKGRGALFCFLADQGQQDGGKILERACSVGTQPQLCLPYLPF